MQNEALDGLLGRYSLGIKHLKDPGPNAHQIEVLIAAALRAPDHGELIPFRFVIVAGDSKNRLAKLFYSYALAKGKDEDSCNIESERVLRAPVTLTVVARIDLHHPTVPAHEQWVCVGGAITNVLNAAHFMGFSGKILSGEKVRDAAIGAAFCTLGETLVGWIALGTAAKALGTNREKSVTSVYSYF